jgi:hypothetical protein
MIRAPKQANGRLAAVLNNLDYGFLVQCENGPTIETEESRGIGRANQIAMIDGHRGRGRTGNA